MITAWIVGRGGLLGSAIARRAALRQGWRVIDAPALPWDGSADEVAVAAREGAARLRDAADGGSWAVIWAAGAAVTSSGEQAAEAEYARFAAALEAIGDELRDTAEHGRYLLASSAGGVYAGSSGAPFTERSAPAPLAPYGHLKLRMEGALARHADLSGSSAFIGRIANLYGPGQRLDKMQGIISHLARARLTPDPASVFVPLDTLRDYLFVDDAAELLVDALERLDREGGVVTKIIASGQASTIAALLGQLRALSKARPRVVLGTSPSAQHQALDLRLRSVVWPELDARAMTPLPVGIDRTVHDIELRLLAGALSQSRSRR